VATFNLEELKKTTNLSATRDCPSRIQTGNFENDTETCPQVDCLTYGELIDSLAKYCGFVKYCEVMFMHLKVLWRVLAIADLLY
jgi:hypothetical protein